MYNNYKWICKTINRGEGRKEGRKFEDERGKISWKILDEKNFDEIAIIGGSCWKSDGSNRRLD